MTLLLSCLLTLHAEAVGPSFAQKLLEVERLPEFRPVVNVGAFSSYDRLGGNDDGFSGKYSFLRKEDDGLVVAEVIGPGAITRMWTAAPAIDAPVEFYLDGETVPRLVLPMRDLFSGRSPPFVEPLAGSGLGGYYSYVPLEFEKSIKVVVRAALFHFYMINYVVYEPQVPVRSFRPGDSFRIAVPRDDGTKLIRQYTLAPGKAVTLFETKQPGRIQSLRLGPAEAFAGKDRGVVLKIYWDGARYPAVNVPVGDFFGYSFGQPATHSLLLGTEDGWNYVRLPMPFEHAARIELISEHDDGKPIDVKAEIVISPRGKTTDEGTLHAQWRRENPTRNGRPFTYLDVEGRGQMVGAILQAQGQKPGDTSFFEGDDEATIDGRIVIHGTGSEDSFNGGWYDVPGRWYGRGSLPFSGCLEYKNHLARTGGYRLFVGDGYTFHHHLRYTIEHGGAGNSEPTDYVGTTLFYLSRPEGPRVALPDVSEREVVDPNTFLLAFFPTPVVEAMLNASLQPGGARVGKDWVYFASFARDIGGLPPEAAELSAEPENVVDHNSFMTVLGPPQMVLSVDVLKAGKYAISADGFAGPMGAALQLRANDEPVGKPVDFYAPARMRTGLRHLGEVNLAEGRNFLYLALPGKDARSGGESVDLISLQGARLP